MRDELTYAISFYERKRQQILAIEINEDNQGAEIGLGNELFEIDVALEALKNEDLMIAGEIYLVNYLIIHRNPYNVDCDATIFGDYNAAVAYINYLLECEGIDKQQAPYFCQGSDHEKESFSFQEVYDDGDRIDVVLSIIPVKIKTI